jgi:hypothetical protein
VRPPCQADQEPPDIHSRQQHATEREPSWARGGARYNDATPSVLKQQGSPNTIPPPRLPLADTSGHDVAASHASASTNAGLGPLVSTHQFVANPRRAGPSTVRVQLPISPGVHFGTNSGGAPTPTMRPRRRLQLPDSGRRASTVALSLALGSRRKIEHGPPPGWTKLSNGQSAVALGALLS